jgi:hypothetical protein
VISTKIMQRKRRRRKLKMYVSPFILLFEVKLMQVARTERYSPCSNYRTTVSTPERVWWYITDVRIRGMPKRKGLGGAAPAPQAVSGIFH